ncbi:class I SAM-dependent methyltransferase [Aliiruegeria lutimaris]|uniref:Ubiquinone/menaquinone biosynthesis C-methylase UbiE n=1 Tax=Aliiruegeria lutimaris TaxID=571298 RepID=A0A1G9M0R5_9RHOB|nr:class I SAM-dependent methyltransferase [Aliiruegeria lutimaris]SDL67862.1 Ubiquinone/menaquinone biosynthesis C-methylase UbiE [Aliiruegeria lutimaris]
MNAMQFDPVAYKLATTRQWQNAAKAWSEWGRTLRVWLGPATEIMIDSAEIRDGDSVLDVAAGAGDQSMQVADRVGADGYVLATDISSNILDHAAANARSNGYGQIDFRVMDGEELTTAPECFDAVVSRVGMIYFPDQVKALSGIHRTLKPGGWFSAIVYSTPERNGFFSIPVGIIRKAAQLPPPAKGQPGPFSLGQPGVLAGLLAKAGFANIRERTIAAPLDLPRAADCVRFERESFGALHEMLKGLGAEEQSNVWDEIESALQTFENGSGFSGPCELIVVAGQK